MMNKSQARAYRNQVLKDLQATGHNGYGESSPGSVVVTIKNEDSGMSDMSVMYYIEVTIYRNRTVRGFDFETYNERRKLVFDARYQELNASVLNIVA